jgi:hypothetical protein
MLGQENLNHQHEAYINMVMPFQIISNNIRNNADSSANLFDEVTHQHHDVNANELIQQLKKWSKTESSSTMLGDFSKYYGFMRNHFCDSEANGELIVFNLDQTKLKAIDEYGSYKNMHFQFSKGAILGSSDIKMERMEDVLVLVNPNAGIGFFILGFKCISTEKNVANSLSETEFFRNIGWRLNQKHKSNQYKKHAWIFKDNANNSMTIYGMLKCYFSDLTKHIRFYQDRAAVMYTVSSASLGSKNNDDLSKLAYDIIRVPDRNAPSFEHALTEPSIHRVGRNVAFSALNEGALVIETTNNSSSIKTISNKFFPAFILAINQRELLLNTMQFIVQLDSKKLKELDQEIFVKMENLRKKILILQLKQIFYSVSNHHEVELFFTNLQKAFAIEKIIKENQECVREMFNLLETNRNQKLKQTEERNSKIINTILAAIGFLGVFSFFDDFYDFWYKEINIWYKVVSIAIPCLLMAFVVKLVFKTSK